MSKMAETPTSCSSSNNNNNNNNQIPDMTNAVLSSQPYQQRVGIVLQFHVLRRKGFLFKVSSDPAVLQKQVQMRDGTTVPLFLAFIGTLLVTNQKWRKRKENSGKQKFFSSPFLRNSCTLRRQVGRYVRVRTCICSKYMSLCRVILGWLKHNATKTDRLLLRTTASEYMYIILVLQKQA